MSVNHAGSLAEANPQLALILSRSAIHTPALWPVSAIRCETVMVPMRDGVRLATDVYLPKTVPAPAIVFRTPYSRVMDSYVAVAMAFARRGYVVISQDCRGTGDSEPETWDYYMYESEDSFDCIEWVGQQAWFDGFIGSFGGSYTGQVQWQMAMHPRMSTIVPDVSGLGVAFNTVHLHMFVNAYARSVGKGEEKVDVPYSQLERHMLQETLATGYFNEPLQAPVPEELLSRYSIPPGLPAAAVRRLLWKRYCSLSCAGRAGFVKEVTGAKDVSILEVESLSAVFGPRVSHDAHTLPHPDPAQLCQSFHAPPLMRTGWYDWGLNDALATWELLVRAAPEPIRSRCRLFISPASHNMPGYHEGMADHPELQHNHGVTGSVELLLRWYAAVREGKVDSWPRVIYYLMGANEWRVADAWPLPEAIATPFYLAPDGKLDIRAPEQISDPDEYTYDPEHPTPTVGGSIVSYVYTPGSADVSEVQKRTDVLTYTTELLEEDLDVVGPLRLIVYVSSSARDTDFAARLTDIFPDGRAVRLQNGVLRARYRHVDGEPELLEPGQIYRLEIDLWATANRFKAGHRLRLDISSADFPRFDRNTNRGGEEGPPVKALQTIYRDSATPSYLLLPVLTTC